MKRSWADLIINAGCVCVVAGVGLTFAGWVFARPHWIAAGGKLTAIVMLAIFVLLVFSGRSRR